MIIVGSLFGAKPLLEPRLMSTLLTPYVVLPLFAPRFTGGIWVSFIKAHLINWWPSLEIYDKHLLGWNLWICFPCMCNLGCPGIFMEYNAYNAEPCCLCVGVYQRCPQTRAEMRAHLGPEVLLQATICLAVSSNVIRSKTGVCFTH